MAQQIEPAEWYEIANNMSGCICPTCQTGKDNLATYPDTCPHAQHLKFMKASFECLYYTPLKQSTEQEVKENEKIYNS